MTDSPRPSNTEHPVALGSFRSWLRVLWRGRDIDGIYIPRLLFVCLTTLLTSPLRAWERIRYGRTLRATTIHPSPIFIIGHWRSGTTHLQNLLCQDKNLGFLSTFQAMAPGFCLTGDPGMKRRLATLTNSRYKTRLIDNIPLSLDAPQEDEFALAGLTPWAFIHAFSFPRQTMEIFRKAVLFEDMGAASMSEWMRAYLSILRKATWISGGRRLVAKNCAHSARIKTLLKLFPDAKFIHIHRNPYQVFLSTLHLYRTVLLHSQLQRVDPMHIETCVLRVYVQLMQRFLCDKSLIPAGNLVEIRFEDLEREPLDQLQRIYSDLGLPGFGSAERDFRAYLASVSAYRKNRYEMTASDVAKINEQWAFAFDAWGYERVEPQLAQASMRHGRYDTN